MSFNVQKFKETLFSAMTSLLNVSSFCLISLLFSFHLFVQFTNFVFFVRSGGVSVVILDNYYLLSCNNSNNIEVARIFFKRWTRTNSFALYIVNKVHIFVFVLYIRFAATSKVVLRSTCEWNWFYCVRCVKHLKEK